MGQGVSKAILNDTVLALPLTRERDLNFLCIHFLISFIESSVENLNPKPFPGFKCV